jgi:hypothetical protein
MTTGNGPDIGYDSGPLANGIFSMRPVDSSLPRISSLICIVAAVILVSLPSTLHASEPCRLVHGRAHSYGGDGRLRIWEVGTHHEFQPDDSSWDTVLSWLQAGVTERESKFASQISLVDMYADFLICPTEPWKKGSVQQAAVKSADHRHYIHRTE